LQLNKKPANALILQYIDTRHSPTCFGTLKCHHQEVKHDAIEKEIRNGWKLYIVVGGVVVRMLLNQRAQSEKWIDVLVDLIIP
jgi:hypothetical protein